MTQSGPAGVDRLTVRGFEVLVECLLEPGDLLFEALHQRGGRCEITLLGGLLQSPGRLRSSGGLEIGR